MIIFKNRKFVNVFILVVNVLFIGALAFGEWRYIHSSRMQTIQATKDSFIGTNTSLSSMTSNYFVGESRLCRSWANYLNNDNHERLTIEEAVYFVEHSITDQDIVAHVIKNSDKKGLSTKGHASDPDNKNVDFSSYFLSNVTYTENTGVKVSPQYSDPINNKPSIAFYTEVKIKSSTDPTESEDAFLLRVVPLRNLEAKWTFPSSFEHLSVAVIDNSSDGEYIYRSAFSMTNFFEYYNKYNHLTQTALDELKVKMVTEQNTLTMKDATGTELFVAYSQMPNLDGNNKWTIITAIPVKDINNVAIDWLTISIIGIGLGVLFVIDLTVLLFLNKKLQETAKDAESANKAKTEFLSTMSHDIRTPMNAIVGLTNIASRDPNNPDMTQDALKKIALASNHLLTLINDILDISKVESGKLTMNPLSFSIVDSFENLVNISQPMVRAKNIDFSFRTHNFDYEWLYADKLRLNQIFINILSNAIKYTEAGGKVSVDLIMDKSDKDDYVRITYIVSDTGIGMSEEFMAKMYDPFIRETDSRINRIEGTGLGLAITKKMVDLMEGTIECESKLEEGTKFTIILDIKKGDNQSSDISLNNVNILVVDNDEEQLKTDEDIIKSLGASAILSKPSDVLDIKDKVDIILYDLNIDDNTDILDKLKKLNIPIIITSIYDLSDTDLLSKANGFISKPIFRSTLYNKINGILNINKEVSIKTDDYSDIKDMNILIAEDNDINYEIIKEMLNMYNINAFRAIDGEECLNIIKESKPGSYDLIFMDIQMPKMNGLDVTKNIRELDSWAKNIPIIAMTADAFSENINECLRVGMNGHIAKPIDLNVVLNEIRRIKEEKKQ